MKHGRGTRDAAPAFDAAGCSDAPGTPLPVCPAASRRIVPRGFHVFLADSRRRELTQLRLRPIRAESGLNRPYRFRPKLKKKKKKKVQNALFDLYLNPTLAQFTQTPKHKLSTSPHILSLTCLCALYLCFVYLVAVSCILISKHHGMF